MGQPSKSSKHWWQNDNWGMGFLTDEPRSACHTYPMLASQNFFTSDLHLHGPPSIVNVIGFIAVKVQGRFRACVSEQVSLRHIMCSTKAPQEREFQEI